MQVFLSIYEDIVKSSIREMFTSSCDQFKDYLSSVYSYEVFLAKAESASRFVKIKYQLYNRFRWKYTGLKLWGLFRLANIEFVVKFNFESVTKAIVQITGFCNPTIVLLNIPTQVLS